MSVDIDDEPDDWLDDSEPGDDHDCLEHAIVDWLAGHAFCSICDHSWWLSKNEYKYLNG